MGILQPVMLVFRGVNLQAPQAHNPPPQAVGSQQQEDYHDTQPPEDVSSHTIPWDERYV